MAFEIQQRNPLDLRPSVGIGVGLPFSSTSVFNTTYTTQEALKSNLINFLLTEPGERFLNTNLGAGLRSLLFTQATEDKQVEIEAIVRSGVYSWFPNIEIRKLVTGSTPDSNSLTLYLKYSIKNTNIEDEIVINFEQ